MYAEANTLDDLLHKVFKVVPKRGLTVTSTRGVSREMRGVILKLTNPRARLSRTDLKGTVFSCLGETIWYLSKTNKVKPIAYYLPRYNDEAENGRVHGGYGPRLFNFKNKINQIGNIIKILKNKPTSRQAVVQLFQAQDISTQHKDTPCTCTLQFFIRQGRLHAMTHMRSNDAYKGLPHDVFAFTMLQELVARALDIELGEYIHSVGSFHIYESDLAKAKNYLKEAWQDHVPMPPMPLGDPWLSVRKLVRLESAIRQGGVIHPSKLSMHDYWKDLVRLLLIFRASKKKQTGNMRRLQRTMKSKVFDQYILKRLRTAQSLAVADIDSPQLAINFPRRKSR